MDEQIEARANEVLSQPMSRGDFLRGVVNSLKMATAVGTGIVGDASMIVAQAIDSSSDEVLEFQGNEPVISNRPIYAAARINIEISYGDGSGVGGSAFLMRDKEGILNFGTVGHMITVSEDHAQEFKRNVDIGKLEMRMVFKGVGSNVDMYVPFNTFTTQENPNAVLDLWQPELIFEDSMITSPVPEKYLDRLEELIDQGVIKPLEMLDPEEDETPEWVGFYNKFGEEVNVARISDLGGLTALLGNVLIYNETDLKDRARPGYSGTVMFPLVPKIDKNGNRYFEIVPKAIGSIAAGWGDGTIYGIPLAEEES